MRLIGKNILRRRFAVIGLSVVAFAALSGVSSGGGVSTGQAGKVFYLGCDQSNPFCASYNKTMESTLKAGGYSVTSLYNKFDPSAQAQQMAQATAQRPTGIVVFVADSSAIVPSLARASAAGVPVVVVGTAVNKSGLKYVVVQNLQNSRDLGRFAAMNVVEGMRKQKLTRGNVIALTGTSSQIDVQLRMAGFRGYLKKFPQFKLVEVQDAGWDPIKSASIAKAMYAKYSPRGGIQGVYGMADYMAVAAINAAKSAGLKVGPTGIVFTGSNCSTSGIQAMRTRELYGNATQSPKVEATAGGKIAVSAFKGKKFAKKTILNPEARFTRANMAKYVKQCTY
jgi:ribose transport system substrate-binding protein